VKNRIRIWWVVTFILLNIFFFIRIITIHAFNDNEGSITFRASRLIADTLIIFGSGSALTALVALFPYRSLTYRLKLQLELPVVSSLLLAFFIVMFGYTSFYENFKGVKLFPKETFEELKAPDNLDCTSIKKGKFEVGGDIIERQGVWQFETTGRTNERTIYKIEWTGNCEYLLTSQKDTTKVFRFKVMEVTADGFTCYSLSESGRNTIRYQVKRMKSSK